MTAFRLRRCGSLHTFFFVVLATLAGVQAAALSGCLAGGRLPPPISDAPLDRGGEQAARELYERGVGEVGERRYEPAHAAFDSVVDLYPGSRYSGISLRERGLTAYRLGRHERAAEDLRRFRDMAPAYETTDTVIVLASALQLKGDPVAGLETLALDLPAGDSDAPGARIVTEAAVRDLEPGQAGRLVAKLPQRPFLAPLFQRAAEEIRASNPERAAALARIAARLGGAGATRGGSVAEEPRRFGRSPAVGAVLPEGGRLAAVAQDIQDGARMALEELAGTEAAAALQVMPEGGAEATVAAVVALAERGVRVVIGPLESEPALAAAAEARKRGILLVSPTATDSTLLHMGSGVVTLNAIRGELGEAMGRFAARELGLLRAAVLAEDHAYGRANAQGFRSTFEGGGGEVVLEEFFPRHATNFGAALRLARRRGAEALFLPTRSADQVLTVLSQMEYYSGGTFRMLGTEVWRDERFLQRAGGFAEGGYFVDTFSPDPSVTRYWEFRAEYSRRFGRPLPSNFPGWGYDAVILALRHLSDAESVTIETTYRGAAATYRIREGRIEKVPVISRIEKGAPVMSSLKNDAR